MHKDSAFQLTESMIKECCGFPTFTKGENYIEDVYDLKLIGDTLHAKVQGSMPQPYKTKIILKEQVWKEGHCTCPADLSPCKHLIATLLKYVREGAEVTEPSLQKLFDSLEAETLRSILLKLIEQHPDLLEDVQVALIKPQKKPPAVNTQAISRKITYLLRQEFDHWHDDALSELASEIEELIQQVVPFLEAEEGMNALNVLKSITDPLIQEMEIFENYGEDDLFFELIEKLEGYWIEAILMTSFNPEEKKIWLKRLFEWNQDLGENHFVAALEIMQSGWDYPLLKAVLHGKSDFDETEIENEEMCERIAPAALRILKRRQDFDKGLLLTQLALLDEEHADLLIETKCYPEAIQFIKENIQAPHTIVKLSKHLYDCKEPQRALEIALFGLFFKEAWGNTYSAELLRWTRDLAFELKEKEAGIKAEIHLLALSPSFEDYIALQKGAEDQWEALKPDILTKIQKRTSFYAVDPIKILLHEDMIDAAIQLADKSTYIPDILLHEALIKRPQWALKKCQEAANQAIQGGSNAYDQATIWLDHAYTAAQQAKVVNEWVKHIQDLLHEHQRKRNLVPKLKELLVKHKIKL